MPASLLTFSYQLRFDRLKRPNRAWRSAFVAWKPYLYTISGETAADFDALKASGVMQIKKIYDLMYEGSASNVKGGANQQSIFNFL